jgi:hypothetical protein
MARWGAKEARGSGVGIHVGAGEEGSGGGRGGGQLERPATAPSRPAQTAPLPREQGSPGLTGGPLPQWRGSHWLTGGPGQRFKQF